MVIKGSMNYTPSGRKRGHSGVTRKTRVFKELKSIPQTPIRKYKSHESTKPIEGTVVERPKSKHTIAIAYNKGPYQVISENCIKDIGR
jgi:hypothetical protein